jgi:hypothetical protein
MEQRGPIPQSAGRPETVEKSRLTLIGAGRYVADASDLGWPAGHWPERIALAETDGRTGSPLSVVAHRRAFPEPELLSVTYRSMRGTVVTVHND